MSQTLDSALFDIFLKKKMKKVSSLYIHVLLSVHSDWLVISFPTALLYLLDWLIDSRQRKNRISPPNTLARPACVEKIELMFPFFWAFFFAFEVHTDTHRRPLSIQLERSVFIFFFFVWVERVGEMQIQLSVPPIWIKNLISGPVAPSAKRSDLLICV